MSISSKSSSRILRKTVQPFTSVLVDPMIATPSISPSLLYSSENLTPKSNTRQRNFTQSKSNNNFKYSDDKEINNNGDKGSESRDGSLRRLTAVGYIGGNGHWASGGQVIPHHSSGNSNGNVNITVNTNGDSIKSPSTVSDHQHLPPQHHPLNVSIDKDNDKDSDPNAVPETQRRLEDSIFICGLQNSGKFILMKQLKSTFGKKKSARNSTITNQQSPNDKNIQYHSDTPTHENKKDETTGSVRGVSQYANSPEESQENDKYREEQSLPNTPHHGNGTASGFTLPATSPSKEDIATAKERDQLRYQRTIALKFKLANKHCDTEIFPLPILHLISEYAYDDNTYNVNNSNAVGPVRSEGDIQYGGLSFHFFYFPTAGKVSKYFQSLSGIMGLIFVVNLADYDRITVKSTSSSSGGDDDDDLVFENSLSSSMTLFEEYCKIPLNYFDLNYRFILLLFINKTEFHNKITHGDQGFPIEYFDDFPTQQMLSRQKEKLAEREKENKIKENEGNTNHNATHHDANHIHNENANTPSHSSSSSSSTSLEAPPSLAANTTQNHSSSVSSAASSSSSSSSLTSSTSTAPSSSSSPPPSSFPPLSTPSYCHDASFVLRYIKNSFMTRHSLLCQHSSSSSIQKAKKDKERRQSQLATRERRNTLTGNEEEKGGDRLGALFDPPNNPSMAGVSSSADESSSLSSSSPSPSPSLSKELSQLYILDIDVLEEGSMMQIFATLKDFTLLKFVHQSFMNEGKKGKGKGKEMGENGLLMEEDGGKGKKKGSSFFACCSSDNTVE